MTPVPLRDSERNESAWLLPNDGARMAAAR